MQVDIKPNYIVFASIALAISFLSKVFASAGLQWYYTLNLPSYTPPGWFISTIWMIIYVLTVTAVILVWNRFERDTYFYIALALFALNAMFNLLWTYIFFYKHHICLSFADALMVFATVLALIVIIGRRSMVVAALLIPYLLWISFALWLNLMICIMN